MEILETLGIDWKLLLAQIINFVVLIFVLRKFLYKPMVTMLEDRKEKISKGLADSKQAEEALAVSEEKVKELESDAYEKARKIVSDAKTDAKKEAATIITKAEDQAAKIIDSAKKEAAEEKDKALANARSHISNLIMLAIEKVVGEELEPSQKDKMTTAAIKDL